jgi:hypothetical protein
MSAMFGHVMFLMKKQNFQIQSFPYSIIISQRTNLPGKNKAPSGTFFALSRVKDAST